MKTALVTGASRGIGETVARRLAGEGYEVALLARDESALKELSSSIIESGGKAFPLACDVTDQKAVASAVGELREKWDELTLLFNNAGTNYPGTVEIEPDDFRKIYEVNVFGAFYVLREVVPWLKQAGDGTIVNLASIAGTVGFAGAGGYCTSKFALRGLNESLHHELEPLGIRVAAVSPSWVDTDMAAHCPFDRDQMLRPDDIADAVLYIASLGKNVSVKEIIVGCRKDLG